MARRGGSADLPLHHGRVPAWLGQRMARLGAVVAQAIVHDYGRDEFLRRLEQRTGGRLTPAFAAETQRMMRDAQSQ